MTTREVPCPRCHEPCGWCSDYRHMHAVLKLPGSKRRCAVPGYEPEGDACPVCHGSMRALQTVTYTSLPAPSDVDGQASMPAAISSTDEPIISTVSED